MSFIQYPENFLIEDLVLTKLHIKVIELLRKFYQEFNLVPSTKAIINYAAIHDPSINLNSLLFAQLFKQGIAQACRIANLPKSPRCL